MEAGWRGDFPECQPRPFPEWIAEQRKGVRNLLRKLGLQSEKGVAPIVAIVIIGGLVLGSVGTVVASDKAKPGDFLYPVDTAMEGVQLALTPGDLGKANFHTQIAGERVEEVKALLDGKGVTAPGLDVALANLVAQKKAVADLLAQNQELKNQAKTLEDLFEQKEKELEAAIKEAKAPLKAQKRELKVRLAQALEAGDSVLADQLRSQIAQIEAQLEALEIKEEELEEALEAEEERLEAQMEAKEEELERLEEEIEELEEREEELREQAEEAEEWERDRLERETERVAEEKEEAEEKLREAKEELEESSEEE